MKFQIRLTGDEGRLKREVKVRSGVDLAKCYQCGECTAGCPMTPEMDAGPTKVLRLIQLGMEDELFNLNTPYYCASCETCTTRCPNDIDIAQVMDVVRQMARLKWKKPPVKEPNIFQDVFLDSLKHHGTVYEPLVAFFNNFKSLHFFQDLDLAPKLLLRGRMPLLPHQSKNKDKLLKIMQNAEAFEKEAGKKVDEEDHHGSGH